MGDTIPIDRKRITSIYKTISSRTFPLRPTLKAIVSEEWRKRKYQNEIEKSSLIDINKVTIPGLEIVFGGEGIGGGSINVFTAVLDDFGENFTVDVGKRDAVMGAVVFDHMADGLRLEGNGIVDLEIVAIGALESDFVGGGHGFGNGEKTKIDCNFCEEEKVENCM